ncbi:MAG: hypothetical protein QM703_08450 [Gemmatales bacterium]
MFVPVVSDFFNWFLEPMTVGIWLFSLLLITSIVFVTLYIREKLHQRPEDYSDQDAIAIMQSDSGVGKINMQEVIYYAKLDRKYRFKPGTAKRLLQKAVSRWGYYPSQQGDQCIHFKEDYSCQL